ncbi:MAG: hypothetical protein ABIK68_08245 [bacterium]
MAIYNEDTLVQQTTADYLLGNLGWDESINAMQETLEKEWKERSYLKKWSQKTRYSLIVSISAPEVATDIYTPIANMLEITVPIEINV